ncbi:hypothetical protein [Streptomyces sp. NPDC055607]
MRIKQEVFQMRCCLCSKFIKKEGDDTVRYYDGYALHFECGDSAYAEMLGYLEENTVEQGESFRIGPEIFQAYVKHMGLIGKVSIPQFVDDYMRQHKQPSTKRGGARPGAGRPSKGKYRSVGMTLPVNDWGFINKLVEKGEYSSYAEYFRHLHEMNMLHVAMVKELNQ